MPTASRRAQPARNPAGASPSLAERLTAAVVSPPRWSALLITVLAAGLAGLVTLMR
ncbi:MAG TPA: hypothetical protein VEB20_04905 [Azospirillaceae bacterium]|nr:hypothetical protein [Azospirillaceae bacterium]